MPLGLRRRIREWTFRPWLDWAQVEVSTDCNARCIYCPTAALGKAWSRRHMSLAEFRPILAGLTGALQPSAWRRPLLHLQGWGEPLLNPDFLAIAAAAKAAGLRIGTTSNGMMLDSAMAGRLVDLGFDVISLSVAGVDARNDAARRGTRLERVFEALASLDRHRQARQVTAPSLHIAYTLLASGLEGAERLPETFAGRGVDQIVVSTLGLVIDEAQRREVIAPQTEAEWAELDRRLAGIARRAADRGMELHYRVPPPPGRAPGLCFENIQAAVVVTIDGDVTPCMFSRFDGETFVFGNLKRQSLSEIWWSDPYLKFRRTFWDGRPPARCLACDRLDGTGLWSEPARPI